MSTQYRLINRAALLHYAGGGGYGVPITRRLRVSSPSLINSIQSVAAAGPATLRIPSSRARWTVRCTCTESIHTHHCCWLCKINGGVNKERNGTSSPRTPCPEEGNGSPHHHPTQVPTGYCTPRKAAHDGWLPVRLCLCCCSARTTVPQCLLTTLRTTVLRQLRATVTTAHRYYCRLGLGTHHQSPHHSPTQPQPRATSGDRGAGEDP